MTEDLGTNGYWVMVHRALRQFSTEGLQRLQKHLEEQQPLLLDGRVMDGKREVWCPMAVASGAPSADEVWERLLGKDIDPHSGDYSFLGALQLPNIHEILEGVVGYELQKRSEGGVL